MAGRVSAGRERLGDREDDRAAAVWRERVDDPEASLPAVGRA